MEINIQKESPVQTRKDLEVVDHLKKAGIPFVAIPVLNDNDRKELQCLLIQKLELINSEIDK